MARKYCSMLPQLVTCLVSTVIYFTLVASAFNIEDRTPIVKVGSDGSLFGLSLALHHISPTSVAADNAVLLVGAPTDVRAPEHGIDVEQPGGFYRCSISTEANCSRVIITPRATLSQSNSSNQWLGVSMKSQKPGGKIVVCAHRYTIRATTPHSYEAVIGRCFMLENDIRPVSDSSSFEYTPCRGKTDPNGFYSQQYFGYCQAGTAVSFAEAPMRSESEEYVVIGAPGSFAWTGTVSSMQLNAGFLASEAWSQEEQQPQDKALILKNSLLGAFQISSISTSILNPSVSLWSLDEIGPDAKIHKNSLVGSSLTSGALFEGKISYISGAPGVNLTGAVGIFEQVLSDTIDERLQVVEMIYGDRIASRFGHEVLLVDVTGDGRLDLIVGAPQYYDREKKLGGAVYIYVNKGHGQIGPNATQKIFGPVDSAFGMSITSLGDINMDGADDIAIGAPGEDSWKGAVYIYHGDNSDNTVGVDGEPSQVIRAADLLALGYLKRNITGMGYSLSGGLDMDFNGYPDVAAGSLSDTVILFQSRPIVNIIGRIKSPNKKIVLSDGSNKNKQEYNITFCLKYTSLTATFDDEVKVTATLKLDTVRLETGLNPRASFSLDDPTAYVKMVNMTLPPQSRNKDKCKVLKTFINDEVQDKLSPVKLELSFTTPNISPKRKRRQTAVSVPMPIMNTAIKNMTTGEIQFAKACGEDEICESKLSIAAHYQVPSGRNEQWNDLLENDDGIPIFKLGMEKQIGMVIEVKNTLGEDAHQASLTIELPDVLALRGSDVLEGSGSELHCNNVKKNETLVSCTLGNPFKSNSALRFRLKLTKLQSIYQAPGFEVMLQLRTTSQQPGHDAIRMYPVIVQVEAQLTVTGYASKEQVKFGGVVTGESAVQNPTDAGSLHSHFYEVRNTGTVPAENVLLKIKWPQSIENKKWLFYLLEANVQDGKGNCSLPESVNPLKLEYAKNRQKRDTSDGDDAGMPVVKKSAKHPESSYMALDCDKSASCIEFECVLGTIDTADSTRYIELFAILWNSTFLEEYDGYSEIQVHSYARVTIAQENIKFSEQSRLDFKVSTSVLSEVPVPPVQEVKWWIIVVASVAGVVLLVCLIVLLWKCGFFKRREFGDYQKARRHKQASQKADEREMLY